MLINNAVITGSFTVNGVDVAGITGSSNVSSSYLALSASYLTTSASYASASGSLSTRVTNLEATSSTVSSSFAATSGSIAGRVTTIENKYATTGSNTFSNLQYISSSTNAQGFTTSASLYTDGGLRVGKDSFVSGTAYFNNVVVYGTSSIQYITSSQVNVGANIINLNTQTPAVRFGGMAVADSGSNAGVTGSMLWDSVYNRWIYSNPSGSSYDGGMLISGPRNTSGLGNELGTTACYLMAGQGGDHITSSAVYTDTNATCFYGTSVISGSGDACFQGNVAASRIGVGTPVPGQLIEAYKTDNDAIIKVSTCAAGAYFAADSQGTDGYYGLVLQNNGTDRWLIGGYATSDFTLNTARTGGSRYLTISRASGVACFACQICTPAISFNSNINSGLTAIRICNPNPGSSAYSDVAFFNDTTSQAGLFYNSSTRSADGGVCSFSLYNDSATGNIRIRTGNNIVLATGAPATDRLTINSSGVACFAGQICSPFLTSTCLVLAGSGYFPAKMISMGGAEFSRYNTHIGTRLIAGSQIAMVIGTRSNNVDYDDTLSVYNGSVGIGTCSPTFGKLSIYGTDDTTLSSALWGTSTGAGIVAAVYNGSTTNNSVAGIRLVTRNSGASVWNMYNVSRGNDTGDLAFGNGSGGAGSEKMRLTNSGALGIGTQAPQAALHSYSGNASTVLQTGSQNYVMFGKVIQSYGGTAVNLPLFIACPGGNNGLFVKIDVRGVNAVGNIAYTSTMYAFQYRIGGGLQATNVVTCGGVNLGNPGYSAGTLCWCNAASSAPVLIYSQNNNGYILEALDVYVTTRDSAEVYFCTNYVTCG